MNPPRVHDSLDPVGTPGMGANLQGSSPLQEVRIDKLLAKDKVASARMWLEEVWSKTARRGTRTAYKAQPLDEQAQHGRSPLTRGRVNAAFVRWKFAHLIRGDLRGNVPQRATPPGNRRFERAGVSSGHSSVEVRESGRSEGPNRRTGKIP